MSRSIEVLVAGPLTTVQDLGRLGHLAVGVGRAGAADRGSYLLGNRLLGNEAGAPVLEATLGGLGLRAHGDAGHGRLTDREREILQMTAEGLSAARIGDALFLSPATVKTQLRSIYEKLGVSERAAAVAVAMRRGIVE